MYVITVIEYAYMHVCEGFFCKQSLYTYDFETLHLYICLLIIYWLFKCGIPSGFFLNFSIISFLTFSCFSLVIISPSSHLTVSPSPVCQMRTVAFPYSLVFICLDNTILTIRTFKVPSQDSIFKLLSFSLLEDRERAAQALWEAAAFNPQLWFT